MTGTEISAENPGLTAGALPNLTLSGLWPGCGGGEKVGGPAGSSGLDLGPH